MSNCKVIAIYNQKCSVTKTTTTVNLGIGLAMQGKKVLLMDADPQADLTHRPRLAGRRQIINDTLRHQRKDNP